MIGDYWNTLANESLDISEIGSLLAITKGNSESTGSCSSSTPNTMYIGFRLIWEIIVDDKFELIDIDPTSRNISSNEDTNIPIFDDLISSVFGLAEYEYLSHLWIFEEVCEERFFLSSSYKIDSLWNFFCSWWNWCDLDFGRIFENSLWELDDLVWHSRRE
jgi:hypothetical protein